MPPIRSYHVGMFWSRGERWEGHRHSILGIRGSGASSRFGRSLGSGDRKSTRLNSSHDQISYAVFCLKKKKEFGGGGLGQRPERRLRRRHDGLELEPLAQARFLERFFTASGLGGWILTRLEILSPCAAQALLPCVCRHRPGRPRRRGPALAAAYQSPGQRSAVWLSQCFQTPGPTGPCSGNSSIFFFFLNDPAPPEIYPFPLPAALPI